MNSNYSNNMLVSAGTTPTNINWADLKKITSIKNQGKCGTCWSFATAAAVESSMIIKGTFLNYLFYEPDLSEQFLLSCAQYGTCSGGYL
jgi:C1A family cysteine protease